MGSYPRIVFPVVPQSVRDGGWALNVYLKANLHALYDCRIVIEAMVHTGNSDFYETLYPELEGLEIK